MQDTARFFAYATWVIMISLGIILAANPFLVYASDPGWIGLATLLAVGFIYLNLSYAAIKRYITKVPEPTNNHLVLATLIFLPPATWIFAISENAGGSELILILVVGFACGLGTFYGNRAGIRARYEYVQKVKKRQAESSDSDNNQ
ncbi:hypothetical protein [Rhodohalobacter sp. 8-1]|uniref:hypothetical protein n=1 Tax=Rhodohalobacter sp. 8-1 TaxID=3131972 RepID=UPI0030EF1EA7